MLFPQSTSKPLTGALHLWKPLSTRPLVVCATDGLQPWQVSKLQQAASQGRRNVKVERLCKEVDLPRATVLEYLKYTPAQPNLSASKEASAVLGDGHHNDGWSANGVGAAVSPQPQRKAKQREAGGQSGVPAWKRRNGSKSIGRQAEATLEMVYRRTPWPSDDVIDGLWDLHKIRKDQVIQWFQNKRREDREGGRRTPQAEQDAGLDWFDQ